MTSSTPAPSSQLISVLERSRSLGFLGPSDIVFHVKHAMAFSLVASGAPDHAVDLGSGGGVPGLILAAMAWPITSWTLLDAGDRRCRFLEEAVVELGLERRVTVLRARAEAAGRTELRGAAGLVVARSFGRPAVTAECGAPLLRVGGELVVSEPPSSGADRWSKEAMAELGLERRQTPGNAPYRFAVFCQRRPCPPEFPRSVGRPAKRPMF